MNLSRALIGIAEALPVFIVLAYALAPWLRKRVRLTLQDYPE